MSRIRLFETENDSSPVEECVTQQGSHAKVVIEDFIRPLVAYASNADFNLRDFEVLALSSLQMEIARAIIKRRKLT